MTIQKYKNAPSGEFMKTRELFSEAEHTDENIIIGDVFLSCYQLAITLEKIENIAYALHGRKFETEKALNKLVKARILRKGKSISNTTLYEVNY